MFEADWGKKDLNELRKAEFLAVDEACRAIFWLCAACLKGSTSLSSWYLAEDTWISHFASTIPHRRGVYSRVSKTVIWISVMKRKHTDLISILTVSEKYGSWWVFFFCFCFFCCCCPKQKLSELNLHPENTTAEYSLKFFVWVLISVWYSQCVRERSVLEGTLWKLQLALPWCKGFMFSHFIIIIIIYPLTARVTGAPHMISQPVSSIFPCSPLPSGTWQTPGLSIPWCLPTSSSVCHVFFPFSLCLARWFWPDLMTRRHVHTTAVCVSLWWSGGLCVIQLPAGSWHGLPHFSMIHSTEIDSSVNMYAINCCAIALGVCVFSF